MNIYKYDTHLHTSSASDCAAASPEEMVDFYRARGYSGFVVTDHFMNGNSSVDRSLPWHEQIDWFCSGYEKAKAYGDKVGFSVFLGIEYNFQGTEFLLYGLDKPWLKAHPELMELSLCKALRLVRGAGAFVIHAHPFREAGYIEMVRLVPDLTDAVEIFNVGNLWRGGKANERARAYAASYGLPPVSGSDRHHAEGDLDAGIILQAPAADISDIISAIRARSHNLICGDDFIRC